jgi:hypothetical protein
MESNYVGLGGEKPQSKKAPRVNAQTPPASSPKDKELHKVIRIQANAMLVNALADYVLYHKPKALKFLKRHGIKPKDNKNSIALSLTTGLVSGNQAFMDDLRRELEDTGSMPRGDTDSSFDLGGMFGGGGGAGAGAGADAGASGGGGTPWAAIAGAVGSIVSGLVAKGRDKATAKLQAAKAYQIEVLRTMQEKIKSGGSGNRATIWAIAIVTCIVIATVGYVITKKT